MKDKKLTKKDICMLIATYNRPDDIDKTIKFLITSRNVPGKIIIIDQSKDKKTKKIVEKHMKKLSIEYLYCPVPSADISMNKGIVRARDRFPLLLTSGDDVDFFPGYMENIVKEFNGNRKIMAIGGTETDQEDYDFKNIKNIFENILLRIFFLPFKEDHKFRITSPYGHTSSPKTNKEIKDAQWIPGFNTCWRSEVYQDYLWPEIRGYNVIDDIDSSYRVYKKYGEESLLITPKCKVHHRESPVARYNDKKRIFVNHEDHFSYFYMHFNNPLGKIKLVWSLTGIILGNILRWAAKLGKENFDMLKNNVEAINYCIKNKENIKNRRYRLFLNDDLSMKEGI